MSDAKRQMEAAAGQRVYEYTDDDGVIYYSFTRAANMISPPVRLRMKSRVGTHLINWLSRLRRLNDQMQMADKDGG